MSTAPDTRPAPLRAALLREQARALRSRSIHEPCGNCRKGILREVAEMLRRADELDPPAGKDEQ